MSLHHRQRQNKTEQNAIEQKRTDENRTEGKRPDKLTENNPKICFLLTPYYWYNKSNQCFTHSKKFSMGQTDTLFILMD